MILLQKKKLTKYELLKTCSTECLRYLFSAHNKYSKIYTMGQFHDLWLLTSFY